MVNKKQIAIRAKKPFFWVSTKDRLKSSMMGRLISFDNYLIYWIRVNINGGI